MTKCATGRYVCGIIDLIQRVLTHVYYSYTVVIWISQETATCFIDQLADEYKDYIDVTQPILVAVYEMKLGFSLVLSGALQKKVLRTIEEDNIERVMVK